MNIRGYFWENPVLVAGNRSSFRRGKLFMIVGIGMALLALGVILPLYESNLNPTTARWVFFGISGGASFLLAMLTLSQTHQVIIREKEAMTFEILSLTGLTSEQIVLGYLMTNLSVVGILILASLPLMSMFIFFGGVSIGELIISIIGIMMVSALAGMVGLYNSSVAKKSRKSSSAAIVIAFFIFFGPGFISFMGFLFGGPGGAGTMPTLMPSISIWKWMLFSAWTLALYCSGFMCIFFATSRRVRDLRGDPSKRLRLSFLVFYGLWVALAVYVVIDSVSSSMSSYGQRDLVEALYVFAVLVLGLAAAIIATSPTRHIQKVIDFKNIFKSWVSSGLGYLFVLLAVSAIPFVVMFFLLSFIPSVQADDLGVTIKFLNLISFTLAIFTLGRIGQLFSPSPIITRVVLFLLASVANVAVLIAVEASSYNHPVFWGTMKHGLSFLAPFHALERNHPEIYISGITGGLICFFIGHMIIGKQIPRKNIQATYLYVSRKNKPQKEVLTVESA